MSINCSENWNVLVEVGSLTGDGDDVHESAHVARVDVAEVRVLDERLGQVEGGRVSREDAAAVAAAVTRPGAVPLEALAATTALRQRTHRPRDTRVSLQLEELQINCK